MSNRKVNLVGTLGGPKVKLRFSVVFKRDVKHKRKIKEKQEFLSKVFEEIDFGFWYNSKTNYQRYMKF